VRKVHLIVNKRSEKAGTGIISQKDMSVTIFAFMGFHLLDPESVGIVGSDEQFEAFNHFWRLIAHLLGTEERFNVCAETVAETRGRLLAIKEDIFLPKLTNPSKEFDEYIQIAMEGMWYFDPTIHFESMMYTIKRYVGVPGYHYQQSEAADFRADNKKVFDSMSTYTRFRIALDIIIYEQLSHILIFRWIFNAFRVFLGILHHWPILALRKFGKKYAYVDIFKTKK